MAPEATTLARWRRIALEPSYAWGGPPATGEIRAEAADFLVEERLGFEPDGGAAHLLVLVEKTDANTLFVARELATLVAAPPADVGFAGLKDRRAVAKQWFSVPATRASAGISGHMGQGFRVLGAHAHSRKLRRGALAGNRFAIRVRALEGDQAAVEARAARISKTGVPNYFGHQRFGVMAANLERVRDWTETGRLPRGREPRGFVLSAARSLCFNAVLEARVADGSWNRLLPGEVVSLAGSRSVFVAQATDDTLTARAAAGDVAPSGPLCGSGGVRPVAEANAIERDALEAVLPIPQRLATAGLSAERRALVLRPCGFTCEPFRDGLALSFELPAGAYATAVLRELVAARGPTGAD